MTKTPDDRVIKFQAQIVKVQSMADGALRVTLDLPEKLINIAALLMESKRQGGLFEPNASLLNTLCNTAIVCGKTFPRRMLL